VDSGSVDANAYMDPFFRCVWGHPGDERSIQHALVDAREGWCFGPSGRAHHGASGRDALRTPIEGRWALLKTGFEQEKPTTSGELVRVTMAAWEKLAMTIMKTRLGCMPVGISRPCNNEGDCLEYWKPRLDPTASS
jgi:hypothetical protein